MVIKMKIVVLLISVFALIAQAQSLPEPGLATPAVIPPAVNYQQPVTTYYQQPVTTYYQQPVTTYYQSQPIPIVTNYYRPTVRYYQPPVLYYRTYGGLVRVR